MNFVCNLFLVNQPEHEANIVVVEIGQKPEVSLLNAHQIRISDIFPGSENLILPMLFYTDSHVNSLNWNSHTWSSSDVIFVKVTSSYHVAYQCIQKLMETFFTMKMRYKMVSKKNNPFYYSCEDWIEKSVP